MQRHWEASSVRDTRQQESRQAKTGVEAIKLEMRRRVQGILRTRNQQGMQASGMWGQKEKSEVTALFLPGHR